MKITFSSSNSFSDVDKRSVVPDSRQISSLTSNYFQSPKPGTIWLIHVNKSQIEILIRSFK